MINLLAPDAKKQLHAARQNLKLRRYVLLVLSIIVAMSGVFAIGYYVTTSDRKLALQRREGQLAKREQYDTTRREAAAYAKNLATAKAIIGSQTSASTFLTDLAATLPNGVIVAQADLGAQPNTSTGFTTFRARAKDYSGVLQLKQKLEDSPLFEDVSIANALRADESQPLEGLVKAYPIDITINLKFSTTKGAAR